MGVKRARVAWSTVRSVASDVGILAGAGSVTVGCWQAYSPAGWIVGGALLIVLSYLLGGEAMTRDTSATQSKN